MFYFSFSLSHNVLHCCCTKSKMSEHLNQRKPLLLLTERGREPLGDMAVKTSSIARCYSRATGRSCIAHVVQHHGEHTIQTANRCAMILSIICYIVPHSKSRSGGNTFHNFRMGGAELLKKQVYVNALVSGDITKTDSILTIFTYFISFN